MLRNSPWKFATPPETGVQVDENVLALQAPLVRVHRDPQGGWYFDGPGEPPRPSRTTRFDAVVQAWPHVACLSHVDPGGLAVWSWVQHSWVVEGQCQCGDCERPRATDLDSTTWPSQMNPEDLVSVDSAALTGQVELVEMRASEGRASFHGPGDGAAQMTPVALANVFRRWPYAMAAYRALSDGRAMYWNSDDLHWSEYVLT
jgi:hypothetical protein